MKTEDGARLLSQLVRIPSLSREEGPVVDALSEVLSKHASLSAERRDRNLLARFGHGRPELWLNSHLDTVRPAEGYTFDPWSGDIVDGQIRGLGANDAKGSIVAMAMAITRFAERHPNFDSGTVVLAATCEEEIGGEGLKRLRRELPAPDAIIVGEPNEVRVANCCKGVVLVRITAHGKSAHVSRPWQGTNAVRVAAPLIAELVDDHGLPVDPLLGPATHEVTMIQGGHQSNALPASIILGLDCRTTPTFGNDVMVAHLESIVARHEDCSVEITASDVHAVRTDAAGRLVRAACHVTGQKEPQAFVGVCDFVYCGDVDAIIMGPGKGERSHRADEFLEISELEAAAQAYVSTIETYFGLGT